LTKNDAMDTVGMTIDDSRTKRGRSNDSFFIGGAVRYNPPWDEDLYRSLAPVIRGLGLSLVEVFLSRNRGAVQLRLTVTKPGVVSLGDCSKAHHAVLPRLELAFPDQDLYVEVTSPGIDRVIKDGSEFTLYIGKGVKCYRTDISDWTGGVVVEADDNSVTLRKLGETVKLPYEIIAKAKLDYSQEVED